jgi:hypothetical protein
MSNEEKKKIEARKVAIKLQDGSLIRGCINLHRELDKEKGTFFNRISDLLTYGESPFLVVFGCTFEGQSDRVMIISKYKILWVIPLD